MESHLWQIDFEDYAPLIGEAPAQVFVMPAINAFSCKNADLSDAEITDRLDYYGIPVDLPIVAQIVTEAMCKGAVRCALDAGREDA